MVVIGGVVVGRSIDVTLNRPDTGAWLAILYNIYFKKKKKRGFRKITINTPNKTAELAFASFSNYLFITCFI